MPIAEPISFDLDEIFGPPLTVAPSINEQSTGPKKVPGTIKRLTYKMLKWGKEYDTNEPEEKALCNDVDEMDVVSSEMYGISGWHAPVLDIDIAHTWVPSTTKNHGHLYFDVMLPWEQYKELLEVLAKCGIIEEGYAGASIAKGFSAVRLPWVKKGDED